MPSLFDVLGYAGNLLDLPGSSVRDLLSGNNPFDQWATPFTDQNRATGRDVLRPFLGENEETGMSGWVSSPMEGVKDVAGFGLEMAADPLNFVSLSPLWRALKGRKAAKGANAAELAASKGRYGYVNAKLLADDMLGGADEAGDVLEPTGQKLLGYTPAPENPMFPGKEVVYHGGHDWSASATATHPYGKFDLGRLKAGEGANMYGPGAYFADAESTSQRYRGLVDEKSPYPDPEKMSLLSKKLDEVFTPGREIPVGTAEGMLQSVTDLEGMYWAGPGVKHTSTKVVGPNEYGTGYVLEHLFSDGQSRVDDYVPGFEVNDWADELLGESIPLVEPKSALYRMDMPPGSKSKFLNWEGGLMSQPHAVKDAWASNKGTSFDDLQKAAAGVKAAYGKSQALTDTSRKQIDELTEWTGASKFDVWSAAMGDTTGKAGDLARQYPDQVARLRAIDEEAKAAAEAYRQIRESTANDLGINSSVFYGSNPLAGLTGETVLDQLMGKEPGTAAIGEVTGLREAGVPGTKNMASSTGGRTYNYAVWDQDLLDQMRIREVNGERVPINPMFGPVKAEQRVIPQIADSPLTEVVNPMSTQPLPGLAKPVMQGAAYQALARFNSYGGSL